MGSLLKMNGKGLKFRASQTVPHSPDLHAVIHGDVDTGSEWDGKHIAEVYRQIRTMCASGARAYALTEAIWDNRWDVLKGRDKLDQALSGVRAEEPWALEPEYNYFEDEVNDER